MYLIYCYKINIVILLTINIPGDLFPLTPPGWQLAKGSLGKGHKVKQRGVILKVFVIKKGFPADHVDDR